MKLKARILTYCLIILASMGTHAQTNGNGHKNGNGNVNGNGNGHGTSYPFWKPLSLDGEVNLEGFFRNQETFTNEIFNTQESWYLTGGLKLNTKSYFWHPNFLQLELGGEYSPGTSQDDYLVTPDRSEVRTLKGLNIGTLLFSSKPVSLKSWASWSDTYANRENLTNIRTKTRRLGSALYVRTRLLPLTVSYSNTEWDQHEIQTGRTFVTDHENLEAFTQKSFGSRDQNELRYSRDHYYRRDDNLSEVRNVTDNVRLNNTFYLDREKNHVFRSLIYDLNRRGNQMFHVFNVTESVLLKLPENVDVNAVYNLFNQDQDRQHSRQHKGTAGVSHQLYESLNSSLSCEVADIRHSTYHEQWNRITAAFKYTKKIPKGQLNLAYSYSIMPRRMEAEPVDVRILNEQHVLSDGTITLLQNPYADINSVVIRDITGSIVYQRDFDYILSESGNFIEVQRLPGGQIPNNSAVFIDYTARQSGSYRYNAVTNTAYAGVILFDRFLEVYYRGQFMDYRNVEKSDNLILNYIKQNTFGVKLTYRFAEIGAEYEDRNSTVTPYELMHYYLNIQKRVKKFILALNGNIRDYNMVDEHFHRRYTDLSGGATYEFIPQTALELNLGYRKQRGPQIDLDLLTARLEFRTVYRKLYLTVGADLYRRDYLNDVTDYNGAYIRISRKF